MNNEVTLIISIVSIMISATVAWLTLLRRGVLKMTRPALLALRYERGRAKIWLRTLLYSTGKRGHILESLYLKVRRGESVQSFSHWVYFQDRMIVGSGLKIGEDGISYDHHFLLPRSGAEFAFLPGEYEIDTYAIVSTSATPKRLYSLRLTVTEAVAKGLQEDQDRTAYFEWGPESQTYHMTLEKRPTPDGDLFDKFLLEFGDVLKIPKQESEKDV